MHVIVILNKIMCLSSMKIKSSNKAKHIFFALQRKKSVLCNWSIMICVNMFEVNKCRSYILILGEISLWVHDVCTASIYIGK